MYVFYCSFYIITQRNNNKQCLISSCVKRFLSERYFLLFKPVSSPQEKNIVATLNLPRSGVEAPSHREVRNSEALPELLIGQPSRQRDYPVWGGKRK